MKRCLALFLMIKSEKLILSQSDVKNTRIRATWDKHMKLFFFEFALCSGIIYKDLEQ